MSSPLILVATRSIGKTPTVAWPRVFRAPRPRALTGNRALAKGRARLDPRKRASGF
jgi:hypothetical protein